MRVCIHQRGKERISNQSFQGSRHPWLLRVMFCLVWRGFFWHDVKRAGYPLHVREVLVQYKREQQLFKNLLYETALRGPGQAVKELLPYKIYEGLFCNPQWGRHGKLSHCHVHSWPCHQITVCSSETASVLWESWLVHCCGLLLLTIGPQQDL